MRRIPLLCAVAGLGLAALAAASPAEAAFQLIRWEGNSYCQVWDQGIPTKPFPCDYRTVSAPVPTLVAALANKEVLLLKGKCAF